MKSGYRIREGLSRLTGLHIYRTLPRGVSLFADITRWFPKFSPQTVFDVGANIGQTTSEYLNAFPQARVIAFEPVQATADQFSRFHSRHDRVRLERMALGSRTGTARISVDPRSVASRLVDGADGEIVRVEKLDDYCEQAGIERIDFMKVDTEGLDLEVLRGGEGLIRSKAICVIQVEAGVNPDNTLHCPLNDLKEFMESFDYRIFGLYEQAREFPTNEPHLRRVNPVFISSQMIAASLSDRQELERAR